ncbi:zinc ABC transporter substrate-binding protein [Methanoculleus sp. FWC-SCC3]|uniref:Zinc ABC transporter substrate-binding protein n=1 Tax=Methanoculleus methanifontis TaxID=2584086 RepID=A0ABT8M1F1_9EURY|nr:metal ABC transporter substrate-binding protein [Methanoculleus sp. FWC-SCC3]MDN7012864.1 zinc ABC transporter substrate-binding protein [Methanoculleus sp. FWC-SCC3]
MKPIRIIFFLIALALVASGANALSVVSTTTVLWDPIQHIGGEKIEAIYIADPTICPHMQADIIPNRIQLQREFIRDADLFVAHNGSVDQSYVMPYVADFMTANNYGTVEWVTLADPAMIWNTPSGATDLSREVAGWLIAADPANRTYYEARLDEYLAEIDAANLTSEEREAIPGQDVVVMVWQQDAAVGWLGLNQVSIFAPEFYQGGKFTPRAVVDDIQKNPEKYRDVKYVIENMQSGELAKGLEEALIDAGIPVERVIFTNFPKSLPGVDSLPDVIRYNKGLVTPAQGASAAKATKPAATAAPLPGILVVAAVLGGGALVLLARRR